MNKNQYRNLRFFSNCKKSINKTKTFSAVQSNRIVTFNEVAPLNTQELNESTNLLIKCVQAGTFSIKISKSKGNQELHKTSLLIKLNPFLDDRGLLRVGGRILNSKISYDQKYPIILASNHKFTYLIIKNEHYRLLHAGCQSVLFSLHKRFWSLLGKNSIKKVLKNCVTCFKAKSKDLPTYLMGELLAERITPTRASLNCGIDYAGPFYIKEKIRSKKLIKVYICIFVCCVTKAVHIELARNLSTEAFLNCSKRFIVRSGTTFTRIMV